MQKTTPPKCPEGSVYCQTSWGAWECADPADCRESKSSIEQKHQHKYTPQQCHKLTNCYRNQTELYQQCSLINPGHQQCEKHQDMAQNCLNLFGENCIISSHHHSKR